MYHFAIIIVRGSYCQIFIVQNWKIFKLFCFGINSSHIRTMVYVKEIHQV